MEQVAQNGPLYTYLDNLGLVNYDVCPITGKFITDGRGSKYTIFGRSINLSLEGLNICKKTRQKQGKLPQLIDKRQNQVKKLNLALKLLSLLFIIVWWYYTEFNDVKSYFWFTMKCILTYVIINLLAYNKLFRLVIKNTRL